MKKLLFIPLLIMIAIGVAGCDKEGAVVDFAVDTLAMAIGYELRGNFDWTPDVDMYYNNIMEGKLSLDAAQRAEGYLGKVTHPIIANRMVKLAGMVGFDLDEVGSIAGVEGVDMGLLKTAAMGFKTGLTLK